MSEVGTRHLRGDVAHASPGSSSASVASVVGNVDLDASKYVARLSAQSDRREMIDDLEGMAREVVMAFYEANGGAGDPGPAASPRAVDRPKERPSEASESLMVAAESYADGDEGDMEML